MSSLTIVIIFIVLLIWLCFWLVQLAGLPLQLKSRKALWSLLFILLFTMLSNNIILKDYSREPRYITLANSTNVIIPERLVDFSKWYTFEAEKINKVLLYFVAESSRSFYLDTAMTAYLDCKLRDRQLRFYTKTGEFTELFKDKIEIHNSGDDCSITVRPQSKEKAVERFQTPFCFMHVKRGFVEKDIIKDALHVLNPKEGAMKFNYELSDYKVFILPYSDNEKCREVSYYELDKFFRPDRLFEKGGVFNNLEKVYRKNASKKYYAKKHLNKPLLLFYSDFNNNVFVAGVFLFSLIFWFCFRSIPLGILVAVLITLFLQFSEESQKFDHYSTFVKDASLSNYSRISAAKELNKICYFKRRSVLDLYRRLVPNLYNSNKELHQFLSFSHNGLLISSLKPVSGMNVQTRGGRFSYSRATGELSPYYGNNSELKKKYYYKRVTFLTQATSSIDYYGRDPWCDYSYYYRYGTHFINGDFLGKLADDRTNGFFIDRNTLYIIPFKDSPTPRKQYRYEWEGKFYSNMMNCLAEQVAGMKAPLIGYSYEDDNHE